MGTNIPVPFLLESMYRIKEIQSALLHLVGWQQPYNPEDYLPESMTESESGLYFQDAHPLCTLNGIQQAMPDDYMNRYPDWDMITLWKAGAKVKHNGVVWIALQDNSDEEPVDGDFSADFSDDFGNPVWAKYNYLADYLTNLVKGSISTMVQNFVQMKNLAGETKTLLERRTFFDGAGSLRNVIENRGKLCGYEITPVRSMGVTTKIERIGLQMKGAVGVVKVYLFHSSMPTPIKTFDLNYTNKSGGYQWFNVEDCYLPYQSEENGPGGSWYLVYNQNELPFGMEAINISKDWSREPCGTCNVGSVTAWRELTKYLQISPCSYPAPTTFTDDPEMWPIEHTLYTSSMCYGINVEVSVGCDLTDFIIRQRNMFQTVLQKQVAYTALRTMAMNPETRVNRSQSNVNRMDILYELDGNTNGFRQSGLGYELKEAYKALRLDTQGMDRVCLTCNNRGVRYRSV